MFKSMRKKERVFFAFDVRTVCDHDDGVTPSSSRAVRVDLVQDLARAQAHAVRVTRCLSQRSGFACVLLIHIFFCFFLVL
jgi:hypothetical protein